ncbi:hypothetical protein NE619_03330 [Anaerovorax odorimutans]|uniref:Uncharacterized protein n=1 Tax=Anaerovorax odorimutans TaxID=109327 RepID=A0ABT1RKP6_9FIRM|nr:hypothetical protein [Anaerovorax odorimutans]MCQ4635748.1 hypothetical protein [Anaerovorax odorimutans]
MKIKDLKRPDPGFLRVTFIGKEVLADDGAPYLIMALAEREDGGEVSSDFWILGESTAVAEDSCVTNRDVFRYEEFSDPRVVKSVQVECSSAEFSKAGHGFMHAELAPEFCQAMRLDECEDGLLLLQYFLHNGCITESWADKPLDMVCLFLCNADPSEEFYESCGAKDASFSIHVGEARHAYLAEQTFYCPYGSCDAPRVIRPASEQAADISICVNGLYRFDPWAHLDQFFAALEKRFATGLAEKEQAYRQHVSELILSCPKGKELLVLEWQSQTCVPRFFARKHLDEAYNYEVSILSNLFIPHFNNDRQLTVIDVVPGDYCEGLEIELFSYEIQE